MSRVCVIGNLDMDLVLGPLSRMPSFGREVLVPHRLVRPGGQGFIAPAALAALGEAPRLLTDIGDDEFGAQIMAALGAAEVPVGDIRRCIGAPTGVCLALLNEQRDRGFVNHLGHQMALDLASIQERWAVVEGSEMVLLCGYFCLPGLRPEGGVSMLRRAQGEGITTVLDTGWDPEDWEQGGTAEVRAMVEHTDLFMPNWEEARALTGAGEPEEAGAILRDWGARRVVIKLGGEGAIGMTAEEAVWVPAVETEVVDTVGAGDAFNAGALTGLLRGANLYEAMRLGTAVAAYAIGDHSPRYPSYAQAISLLPQ